MRSRIKRPSGFSLVEVVLAVGIVGFALLSIFSLFSVSLQTNSDTVVQVEALSAVKALPAFLQSADTSDYTQQGFPTVYSIARNAIDVTKPPPIYAYTVSSQNGTSSSPGTTGQSVVVFTGATAPAGAQPTPTTTNVANLRQGRLFGVYLTVSPNFPVTNSAGSVVAHPVGTDLPANPSPTPGGYLEGALAVQVKVYVVPQVGLAPPAGAFPVLTYDLTVPH